MVFNALVTLLIHFGYSTPTFQQPNIQTRGVKLASSRHCHVTYLDFPLLNSWPASLTALIQTDFFLFDAELRAILLVILVTSYTGDMARSFLCNDKSNL